MAALTLVDLTVAPGQVESTVRRQIAQLTGPTLYTAGGEALDPGDFRMGKIFIVLGGMSDGTDLLVPFYVAATGKLMWFNDGTGNEASGDLTGFSGRVEVVGQ